MSNLKTIGISVNDLLVTQAGLRHNDQLKDMIRFVNNGGVFDEASLGSYAIRSGLPKVAPLIEIAEFEDGKYALHNGHHRACAIFLGRHHPYLFKNEYFIRHWKYSDYTDIVLPTWVTPFDVKVEVRTPQLIPWKDNVRKCYIKQGEEATIRFIQENRHEYVEERDDLVNIEHFVAKYGLYDAIP